MAPARRLTLVTFLLLVAFGAASGARGQAPQPTPSPGPGGATSSVASTPAPVSPAAEPKEQRVSRRGQTTIAGQRVDYTASVGDLVLRDDAGKAKATITYVSYVRDGVADRRNRPVTFAFNGGPGSASVWVHLGAFGPKSPELDPEGFPTGPPPGRLVDNEYSLLDATDLVFIDPVETGFSRPAPGEDAKQFLGFTDDVRSVGDFIRLWVSREGRWASPKFIAGESYGTTRAAGLAGYLQDEHGMYLNGIALISSVLNWDTKVFNIGHDLPYILILPTYTAAAWYHGKLPARFAGDRQQALRESEAFATGEYAAALLKGDQLRGEERARVVHRLAELSGLSPRYVEDTDLRIEILHFCKELLRDEGKTIGRLDARYTGSDRDDTGEEFEFDPAATTFDAYFVSLINDYLRRELGYESDAVFRQSAGRRVRPWNYHEKTRTQGYNTNAYANYAETLRAAMHMNRFLKVLVLCGRYDLATPYFASVYTVDHMQLDPELRGNLKIAYYDAGHMMYVRREDHRKFREDFLALIRSALEARVAR
jgi:carboxypeptidase C (cathepsin A)